MLHRREELRKLLKLQRLTRAFQRMPAMLQKTLVILVILMVAGGQVLGMQRGYRCDHGKITRQTQSEHCHRTDSAQEKPYKECESLVHEPCESNGAEDHAAVNESLQANSPGGVSLVVPPFVSVLLSEHPDFGWILRSALLEVNVRYKLLSCASAHRLAASDARAALCVAMLI